MARSNTPLAGADEKALVAAPFKMTAGSWRRIQVLVDAYRSRGYEVQGALIARLALERGLSTFDPDLPATLIADIIIKLRPDQVEGLQQEAIPDGWYKTGLKDLLNGIEGKGDLAIAIENARKALK